MLLSAICTCCRNKVLGTCHPEIRNRVPVDPTKQLSYINLMSRLKVRHSALGALQWPILSFSFFFRL